MVATPLWSDGRLRLQRVALELTGGGLGEGFGELDFTRIFVGGDGGLHVSLELGGEPGRRPVHRRDDDDGFHSLPAIPPVAADYREFLTGGQQQDTQLHTSRVAHEAP